MDKAIQIVQNYKYCQNTTETTLCILHMRIGASNLMKIHHIWPPLVHHLSLPLVKILEYLPRQIYARWNAMKFSKACLAWQPLRRQSMIAITERTWQCTRERNPF